MQTCSLLECHRHRLCPLSTETPSDCTSEVVSLHLTSLGRRSSKPPFLEGKHGPSLLCVGSIFDQTQTIIRLNTAAVSRGATQKHMYKDSAQSICVFHEVSRGVPRV